MSKPRPYSKELEGKLEQILLDFVRPKGQVIPYKDGEQKSAEMASVLLNHWLDTEAKHLVQPAKQAILALIKQEKIELLGRILDKLEVEAEDNNHHEYAIYLIEEEIKRLKDV